MVVMVVMVIMVIVVMVGSIICMLLLLQALFIEQWYEMVQIKLTLHVTYKILISRHISNFNHPRDCCVTDLSTKSQILSYFRGETTMFFEEVLFLEPASEAWSVSGLTVVLHATHIGRPKHTNDTHNSELQISSDHSAFSLITCYILSSLPHFFILSSEMWTVPVCRMLSVEKNLGPWTISSAVLSTHTRSFTT